MKHKNFLHFTLAIYALGCGLSQSLMSLAGALAVGLFVYGTWRTLRDRKAHIFPQTALVSLFAGTGFVLLSLVHLFWVQDSKVAFTALKDIPLFLIPLIPLLPALSSDFQERDLVWPLRLLCVAYLISCLFGIWQVGLGGERVAYGFMKSPIYFAYNLLAALSFFMFWAWDENRRTRSQLLPSRKVTALIGLSTLILCAQALSASRAATAVGILTWTFFLLLICWDRRRIWIFVVSMISLGGLGLTAFRIHYPLQKKIRTALKGGIVNDSSWATRANIWEYNLEIFRDHPIWGVGYKQNYIDTGKTDKFPNTFPPGHHIYAHSIYFQSLAEAGLVGSLLHLSSYAALGLALPATIPVLATTAIGGATENIFHNSRAFHAMLFFLMLAGFYDRARKNRTRAAKA